MKQTVLKTVFLAICVSFFVILTCGCEEEVTTSEKKSRLIAAENIELQKQLASRDKEIERLKSALENCNAEKEEQKQKMSKEMDSMGDYIMKAFAENVQLKEENEQLKKQIEELKNK
jgi:seryl-tRNA synthetase